MNRKLKNDNIKSAIEYHAKTKHSETTVRLSAHYLNWNNKPSAFKVYTKLSSTLLPRNFQSPKRGAMRSISDLGATEDATSISIGKLSEILYFSAGLTREVKTPLGTYYMRAASATGALYPIELYIICQDIPGLEAGVYHFSPGEFSLTQLRKGDYRHELAKYCGQRDSVTSAPLTLAFTSIAWRNSWKYGNRSYRHWFWDSGVIAANLLATTVATGFHTEIVLGFVDDRVNLLLNLDEKLEATIALAPVGIGLSDPVEPVEREIQLIHIDVQPLSESEVSYPEIWKINEESSLENINEVKLWVESKIKPIQKPINTKKISYTLEPQLKTDKEEPSLAEVILRRGSTRRFSRKPISFTQLSNILYNSTRGTPLDFLTGLESIMEIYIIVNAVENLPSGAYFFDRNSNSLEMLKKGEFRNASGHLCLSQSLFADASVSIYLMTDLQSVLNYYGNRGYRAAQFESGVVAGKIYLASYSQGIGCSGSTFYDDIVTTFFSPHALGMSAMMALGVGVPDYRSRSGEICMRRLSKSQLLKGNI